jgi:isoleucyl-tRNA synthetase
MARNFLDGEFNLPQLEEKVLKFWEERNIFEKSLEKNKAKGKSAQSKQFVFYEGPPYANGKPAIHHILSRVVKDVILRYKTMRGYYVPRRAGWDTHGLPVEMAAEKALGFRSKKDIEKFGVKRFNEEAKKQVWIYKDEWERLTNRIGYWLDLKNAYETYAPEYIEAIWGTLAQISKRGFLYKGHKVVPWCTRCGTSLSSHELAQGYKEVVDRSVYVKFKLKNPEKIKLSKQNVFILSWTTTPWTLPGNVALAIGPKITYRAVERDGEYLIAAVDRLKDLGLEDVGPHKHEFSAADLIGLEYEPLFEVAPLVSPLSYKIYPANFVTTTDGTGVVHTAVMYGEEDYELGKKIGLPQHHTVDEEGKFNKDVPVLKGEYAKAKDTEEHIFEHLKSHGNLLRIEEYKHEYPFCWRCGTAILYYARTSWFIAMSKLRKELLKNNETVNWMPAHVKEGRFGEWLREVKDWNLSRERYWGAPLPIWECAKCGHTEVVESLEKLNALAGGSHNNYLALRHGESENIAFRIIDSGNQKFHLTNKGTQQIEQAAKKIKAKKIDLVFASDLMRTKESAEIITKALGIKKINYDKRLREINLGSFSGRAGREYEKLVPNQEDRFSTPIEAGAETLRDVRKRAWDFLRELERKYKGKNILIVSHEDTIWMLSEVALGWSEQATADKKTNNNGVFMGPAEIVEFGVNVIPRDDTGGVDLHRPFVDDIVLDCPQKKCDGKMKRVREVADVWYDSGAMPYASHAAFPADYISEGMDQTRGWFYTLLAIATALGYGAPYKNVIALGLVNDKNGQKMSKSKGNVVEPFAVIEKFGVDALRWYFYAGTPLGEPKNFDEAEVGKGLRKVHLIIYNSFVFWKTYAAALVLSKRQEVATKSKNVLDVWILARLSELVGSITKKLDAYQIREAGLEIESFVDDLSRWYIRRSRKRLQRSDDKKDHEAASATLGFVLLELVKLMAPFTPFFSEVLYAELGGEKESVHLDEWPVTGKKLTAKGGSDLLNEMRTVRELAAMGLAKRAEAGIKVRQPLAMLRVAKSIGQDITSKEVLAILADEINVKKIFVDPILKEGVELDTVITPELREEGLLREVSRMVQELRQTAGLAPKDSIALMLQLPPSVHDAISKNEKNLRSDVGAKSIEYKKSAKFIAEIETKIEGQEAWIGIRKV